MHREYRSGIVNAFVYVMDTQLAPLAIVYLKVVGRVREGGQIGEPFIRRAQNLHVCSSLAMRREYYVGRNESQRLSLLAAKC